MATEKKPAAKKPAAKTAAKNAPGFSAEEKAAMKEYAAELRQQAKAKKLGDQKAANLAALLAAIKKMDPADRAIANKLHQIVLEVAPHLEPRTWYGMPAYADENGKAVVFFQDAGKFKARYNTLGFNDSAKLDAGEMWATSFALVKITPAVEKQISALVKKAAK